MQIHKVAALGLAAAALIGGVAVFGCGRKPEPEQPRTPGVGERAGAAVDHAAEKTAEAARKAAAATKDAAGVVVEKTGEALEKAGSAVEKTGDGMQKQP